jgi:uncharacterized membrane protein YtjA (UPF0391 family)
VPRSIAIKRPPEAVTAAVVRAAPIVLLVAALVALVAGEFSTLREIKAVTVVPKGGTTSGGSHHGYALLVIAVAAAVMGFGALRGGSRPAALAVAALGLVALLIVLVIDLPSLDDTGLIGRTYDLAEAHPSTGFWLELGGAIALAASGLLLLRSRVLLARERAEERERRRQTAADTPDNGALTES